MMRMIKSLVAVLLLVGTVFGADAPVCNSEACKELSKQLRSRMNQSAKPCNDFYEYACGNYKNLYHLGPEESRHNSFMVRNDEVMQDVDNAFKAETNSKSEAVAFLSKLYLECNNTDPQSVKTLSDTITQTLGSFPMTGKSGQAAGKWTELYGKMVGELGLTPIFLVGVYVNRLTDEIRLGIGPGETGLPYEALLKPEHFAKAIEAYKKYMRQSAVLLGAKDDEQLTKAVDSVVQLETNIARASQQNPLNSIRIMSFEALDQTMANHINFLKLINEMVKTTKALHSPFSKQDQVAVSNLGFLLDAARVMDQSPEEERLNLFGWLIAMQFGPLVSEKFKHLEAEFRSVLEGIHHEVVHWEACYNLVSSKLPFVVGRVYIDKHFSAEDRKEATTLVKELKSSFKNILEKNTWLDQQTKKAALEKLDYIKENVGYPDWLNDDKELDKFYDFIKGEEIVPKKFLQTTLRLQQIIIRLTFDFDGTKYNHTFQWPMTPATVNAAYIPSENSIIIPAAVLHTPFFDKSHPYSMNYGSIGAIIGHEITHGFDNEGRLFDKNGKQKNWWTAETLEEFNHRAQCFVKQYGAIYDPAAKMNVNGEQTLGENIADNGGVKESFYAFLNHQKTSGKQAPVLPDLKLEAEQLFFLAYANNWCSITRPEVIRNQILNDPHTPDQYRVNVPLGNSEEFNKAFNCAANSKMNLQHKCAVW